MATIADLKRQEREKKKKDKQKKVKILLSKNHEARKTLSSENLEEVESLLEKILKPARLEKFKYSWSELKKIPKEKRRLSRNALMIGLDKEKYEASKKIRNNFVFGTNSVIRSLEKEKLVCGLVSPDFDLAMIPNHIVSLSRQKRIPFILFPQLKSVSKRCLGFSAKAFGIKKNESISEDDSYKALHCQILNLSGLSEIATEPTKLRIPATTPTKPSASSHPKPEKPVVRNWILKRPNADSRCFVPGGSAPSATASDLDFISFATSSGSKVSKTENKRTLPEEDDDSDSDSSEAAPAPKLKPYVPMFQTLKLKKIKSKS